MSSDLESPTYGDHLLKEGIDSPATDGSWVEVPPVELKQLVSDLLLRQANDQLAWQRVDIKSTPRSILMNVLGLSCHREHPEE